MITLADYWQGRDKQYESELTDQIIANAMRTIERANLLLTRYKAVTNDTEIRKVNSGWRPAAVNLSIANAAPRSKHMTGEAVDISDPEGDLDEWCLANLEVLADLELWQEHPAATKGWCHVQTVPPKSGRRVFYP